MNTTCATIQEHLPELASGRLSREECPEVEAHLAGCSECREVLETLSLLAVARPPVPAGLQSRIQEAVREHTAVRPLRSPSNRRPASAERRRWITPAWGLAAAAVLALLIGRTVVPSPDESGPDLLAMNGDDVALLLPDDGMVAGAPVLDDLTDEDLEILLEELER